MITEDELIKYERDCHDWLTTKEDITRLINEVRRLNAAYARAKTEFSQLFITDREKVSSFSCGLRLVELFEPKSEDK